MKPIIHFGCLTVLFVCGPLTAGCNNPSAKTDPTDEDVVIPPQKVRDAGDRPVASEVIAIDDAVYFCRYNSPFNFGNPDANQPECKAYVGPWWTAKSAALDCALPFGETFSEVETELSNKPCDMDRVLAYCTTNADFDNVTVTCFYEIEPPPPQGETGLDLSSTKAGCEGPGEGIFEAEQDVNPEPSGPLLEEALQACHSNAMVKVSPDDITDEQLAQMRDKGGYIYFEPVSTEPQAGVIFFPGGFVDSRAYAPAAQLLAAAGIAVAIQPVPDYMAISAQAETRPSQVIDAHPEVTQWFIGGHSLGGVAAANYVFKKYRPVRGLIVLGSYLSAEYNLSDRNDLVALIAVGSNEDSGKEGTESHNNFLEGKKYAPPDTTFLIIPGGFHFGFCYQESPRENDLPGITVAEQHTIYTQAIIDLVWSQPGSFQFH